MCGGKHERANVTADAVSKTEYGVPETGKCWKAEGI